MHVRANSITAVNEESYQYTLLAAPLAGDLFLAQVRAVSSDNSGHLQRCRPTHCLKNARFTHLRMSPVGPEKVAVAIVKATDGIRADVSIHGAHRFDQIGGATRC